MTRSSSSGFTGFDAGGTCCLAPADEVVVVDDNYDANAALSRLIQAAGFQLVGRAYDPA
jgi:hypothetical protein